MNPKLGIPRIRKYLREIEIFLSHKTCYTPRNFTTSLLWLCKIPVNLVLTSGLQALGNNPGVCLHLKPAQADKKKQQKKSVMKIHRLTKLEK